MKRPKINVPPITDEQEAAIQADIASDPDAPEATDEQLAQPMSFSDVFPEKKAPAARRGRGPGRREAKEVVTLRLDPDVVAAFKAEGDGWQSRINDTLRRAKKLPKRA